MSEMSEQAQKLYSLAKALAQDPDDAKADDYWEEGYLRVYDCLQANQDEVLSQALKLAASTGDLQVTAELQRLIEYFSMTLMEKEAPHHQALYSTTLFAIPVWLQRADPANQSPVALRSGPALEKLVQSFRVAGLVHKQAKVMLAKQLFSLQQLTPLTYSGVYQLADTLGASPDPNSAGRENAVPGKGQEAASMIEGLPELWFILGLIRNKAEVPAFMRQVNDQRKSEETIVAEFNKMLSQWRAITTAILPQVFPRSKFVVSELKTPDTYYAAFRNGCSGFADMLFYHSVYYALEEQEVTSEEVWAILSQRGQAGGARQIQVAILSRKGNRLIAEDSREVLKHEASESVLRRVVRILHDLGIEQTRFASEVPL